MDLAIPLYTQLANLPFTYCWRGCGRTVQHHKSCICADNLSEQELQHTRQAKNR